jgi:hypothetical protein
MTFTFDSKVSIANGSSGFNVPLVDTKNQESLAANFCSDLDDFVDDL